MTYTPEASERRGAGASRRSMAVAATCATNAPAAAIASPASTAGTAGTSVSATPPAPAPNAHASTRRAPIRSTQRPATGATTAPSRYTVNSAPIAPGPSRNGGAPR